MRAYQLFEFEMDQLQVVDLPEPHPGPNEVLVKLEAASLNYLDWLVLNNQYGATPLLPFVPVCDGAGTVISVGDAVTRFQPGDRVTTFFKAPWIAGAVRPEWSDKSAGVFADGVMRELACFDAYALAHAPAQYSTMQAATLPIAALTAWEVLELAHITTGQTVLILGTGGVSLFALQFAKLRGARVIVISSSDEKLARAKTIGADIGINYARHLQWGALVREASGGSGVDAVVETIGAQTLTQSLEAVGMHGFIGLVGFISGINAALPIGQALRKRVRLQGVSVASLEQHERMVRAIDASGLEPVIDQTFGFDQLRDAYALLASGGHFGKIAIDFSR